MHRPIPVTHAHHQQATAAFQASFLWTPEVLARIFPCKNPNRAAEAWLTNYERQGYFNSTAIDAKLTDLPVEPIYRHSPGDPLPEAHKLAYRLEQRWRNAVQKRLRVFWPTPQFAACYGGCWLGSRSLPAQHKVSHDLLVSAVWVRYFEIEPTEVLSAWVPERELEYNHRSGKRSGPIPDALIDQNGVKTAIEIGGRYPANFVLYKLQQSISAGYSWELW